MIQKAKASSESISTSLDDRLGYFRSAFRNDPAFEVLHFVPLYFPGAGRVEVLSALKELAGSPEGIPDAPTDRTSFGLAAVGSILSSPDQRRILGEFVQSLEQEWTEFYQAYQRSWGEDRDETVRLLQESWSEKYGLSLKPLLDAEGLAAGLVLLTPSLGMEGRVFTGSFQVSWDNVLAVAAPGLREDPSHALFAMIREISFPLARRSMASLAGNAGSADEEESRAGRAAVRSGALILELYCPDDVEAYQTFFLSEIAHPAPSGTATGEAFRNAFPLGRNLEEALKKEILTTATIGGKG
jgi:hypothetical protein